MNKKVLFNNLHVNLLLSNKCLLTWQKIANISLKHSITDYENRHSIYNKMYNTFPKSFQAMAYARKLTEKFCFHLLFTKRTSKYCQNIFRKLL